MRIDDYVPYDEARLINELQGKSRMEQDQIIGEHERKVGGGKI